jgi:hypothetical protein
MDFQVLISFANHKAKNFVRDEVPIGLIELSSVRVPYTKERERDKNKKQSPWFRTEENDK